ncbi:MAG: M3 family metallopeptidase [Flavobacteriales bacterium]|nr:M3 family metallopeptidase [Flavobacteriales bacterium]
MNPLLENFETPFGTTPFSKIKNEHFIPAFTKAIEIAKNEVDQLVNNPEPPTFENTVAALDYSGELLSKISKIFFNLNSAETSPEIQAIASEVSPMLSAFANDISLNENLFERIKTVYNNRDQYELNAEQKTLLETNYKNFVRNGANLSEADKETLRNIDKQLSQNSLKFGENVLAATNRYELHLTDHSKLSGLPEGVIEAAAMTAKQKNKEGWVFTLDYPSIIPFMTYSSNRSLRKEISLANGSKNFKGDELDNQQIVLKIVQLRHQRARLLGYDSHAHFVLEEQMATSPEKVNAFLNDLLTKSKPKALQEITQLTEYAHKLDQIETLQSWDGVYYTEKLKQELFDLDDEKLKPYFQLDHVIQGAFLVANKLYGLEFKQVNNIDTHHPDVKTYEVRYANGNLAAIFYGDYHPRPGKRNGAWMTSLNTQFIKDGINNRPHILNVCNFTKPTETKPSLLTFNEVTTLFHEFGHALHGILANTTYPGLSGTSVYRDFVELPSQVLENWCYEEEALRLFAFHYQTGETIPMELIQKIKDSSTYMEATRMVRQLNFGMLDMAWHTTDPSHIESVGTFEKEATQETQLYPYNDQNNISTAFSHIFQGGYASGYYSYKWAEVLDADAFEFFSENGIFNPEIGTLFQEHILSKGGSEHPMELYKKFRGKEPDSNALLRRAGLLEEANLS